MDRFIKAENCDYIVDLKVSKEDQTVLEPDFSLSHGNMWKSVFNAQFLDAKKSHPIFRAFYVPYYSEKFCVYNNYILYKNVRKIGD